MNYSFSCPLEGCGQKMTVEGETREDAASKLTEMAKGHLAAVHPEVQKTDEQVSGDINAMMTLEESSDELGDD